VPLTKAKMVGFRILGRKKNDKKEKMGNFWLKSGNNVSKKMAEFFTTKNLICFELIIFCENVQKF
jgi:hypothetical protein